MADRVTNIVVRTEITFPRYFHVFLRSAPTPAKHTNFQSPPTLPQTGPILRASNTREREREGINAQKDDRLFRRPLG